MKNIINRLLWLAKNHNKLNNISQGFKVNDHPELTHFLKNN